MAYTNSPLVTYTRISPNKTSVSNQYVGFNRFACEIADNINLKISGRM